MLPDTVLVLTNREGVGDPAQRSLGPGTIVPDLTNFQSGVTGPDAIHQYCSGTGHRLPGSTAVQ